MTNCNQILLAVQKYDTKLAPSVEQAEMTLNKTWNSLKSKPHENYQNNLFLVKQVWNNH